MRYTVIIMHKPDSTYNTTSPYVYNFNPKYNKLTSVTGSPKSWMLDLVKEKDGVYALSSANEFLERHLFILVPESHPLFCAPFILKHDLIDLEYVYKKKLQDFMKSVSEGIVRELNN